MLESCARRRVAARLAIIESLRTYGAGIEQMPPGAYALGGAV